MDSQSAPRKKKSSRTSRPSMCRTSEEMQRMCAMLGEELKSFPDVTVKPMFGLQSYYRNGIIFAALPKTRALGSENAIIFKLHAAPERVLERARQDPRITISTKGLAGWQSFEISGEDDLAAAQQWLTEAWRYALRSPASS